MAFSLLCLSSPGQDAASPAPTPVKISLGQKMLLLPLLPQTEARAEYPLAMRAEADEHGLYLMFDLEGVVLSELSRAGSPFYIDLQLDLSKDSEKNTGQRSTRFRVVGRFDEGQMAVERTISDEKGEDLQTVSKLDADARLSMLRSGTPRVSLFIGRKEVGDHPWKIGETDQELAFDVFVHFADFDPSVVLETPDDDGEGDVKKELTAEPKEPGQQVYPDWHKFVMVRGMNTPCAHTIPTTSMNSLLLHPFSLDDLTVSLRAIGETNAEDDIVRRAESVALMTILNAEVRGGLLMAREHREESVRKGAEKVIAAHAFGSVDDGSTISGEGSDTAGK